MARKKTDTIGSEVAFHGKQILPENQAGRAGMKIIVLAIGSAVLILAAVGAIFVWLSPWS